jgi:HEAT repeat protein
MIDLSPARPGNQLITAVWQARREMRRDLMPALIQLLRHESATLREEILSLLLVNWREKSVRKIAMNALQTDEDFGVRSRAAYGLAVISTENTREEDIRLLQGVPRRRDGQTRLL